MRSRKRSSVSGRVGGAARRATTSSSSSARLQPDAQAPGVAGGGAQLEHEPLGGGQAAAHRQQVVRRRGGQLVGAQAVERRDPPAERDGLADLRLRAPPRRERVHDPVEGGPPCERYARAAMNPRVGPRSTDRPPCLRSTGGAITTRGASTMASNRHHHRRLRRHLPPADPGPQRRGLPAAGDAVRRDRARVRRAELPRVSRRRPRRHAGGRRRRPADRRRRGLQVARASRRGHGEGHVRRARRGRCSTPSRSPT